MPKRNIIDRLKAGESLLMDGATGSELQRRGFDVSQGAVQGKGVDPETGWSGSIGVWSAPANLDAPDLVRKIHEDYLNLGADIIISNNFWTGRSMMGIIGREDQWEECTRRGGEIAVEARNAVNPEAYVAGGFAPSFMAETGNELRKEIEGMARVLAGAGVDFLLPEYFGGDTERDAMEDCRVAVDACAKTNLPVFLGICYARENGKMHYGQSFDDFAKELKGHKVDGILLMCTSPQAISACLPNLRKAFDLPIGAYAEVGYTENLKFSGSQGEQFFDIGTYGVTPDKYAEYAREWKKMGAQIIGGCCATTPEHIKAIAPVVKG
ncbi:MAG: homocysteine S-methyltransferase family protein [Acidobacteriota bacterium]|nr:MAG: homocysteine S-methyltransferase family protein [Acidobacteriota bacterium]